MYQLTSEDLSNLGGPMGSESTTYSDMGHYNELKNAKAAAEKEYGKPIKWIRNGTGFRSPDLRYVMYRIKKVEVKD